MGHRPWTQTHTHNDCHPLVVQRQQRMSSPSSTACVNLEREWKWCCLKAMGLEQLMEEDENEPTNGASSQPSTPRVPPVWRIYSIVPDPHNGDSAQSIKESTKTTTTEDVWMLTALQIDQNLRHMVHFLETKKWEYVSVQLHHNNNNNKNDQYGEEENAEVVASLIQSTVMSFIATTATEIESLRSMVHTTPTTKATGQSLSNHLILHRSGIVQILLERLQREIAQPFGMLQKQRKRVAVRLWQNPLECRLAPPPAFSKRKTKRMNDKNGVDHDNNEDDDLEEELGRALGFSTSCPCSILALAAAVS